MESNNPINHSWKKCKDNESSVLRWVSDMWCCEKCGASRESHVQPREFEKIRVRDNSGEFLLNCEEMLDWKMLHD